jgi:transcriptional regulator of acetoin/glycerol metabolism
VAATGTGVSPLELDERADADSGPVVPLPELECREILRATKYTRGDPTAAATLLQIERTTLYRKLKEYCVEA